MPLFGNPEPLVVAEFQDAALRVALQTIFDSVNASYSISPEITGIITLRRTQLPMRKMLALILKQSIGASEIVEQKSIFYVRGIAGKPGNLDQLQKQISKVEVEAQKKLANLPPGVALHRMSGYVKVNNVLQGILETGAPPQSEIVSVKPQQKVRSSAGELTVVRLTERDILLQPAAGQATRVPLAGFEYYRS